MALRRLIFFITTITALGSANSSTVQYSYDPLERVTTTVDAASGICTAYSYDSNSNRVAQNTTIGGSPMASAWGTGTWGCTQWSP
jgi:YD repeat-containing protein